MKQKPVPNVLYLKYSHLSEVSVNNFIPIPEAAKIHFQIIHLISSAEKFTIVGMKFSLIMMERICFQSVVLSPKSRQIDSSASFTAAGGFAIERTSTRCCFFIDLTAKQEQTQSASYNSLSGNMSRYSEELQ
uniref:Uncharacterized protein n=1 Tax=Laticauda laticaudata TaxID=8630 RepID=A0A8C5RE79_LATLA